MCDCSMVWFLRESAAKKTKIIDLDSLTCAKPLSLNGVKIVDIKDEKDICLTVLNDRSRCRDSLYFLNCATDTYNHIPYDVFDGTDEKIKLEGGYTCDCNMVWFIRIIKNSTISQRIDDLDYVTCATPTKFLDRRFLTLTERDVCPQPDSDICAYAYPKPCNRTTSICENTNTNYRCIDINECQEKTHRCPKHSECVNEIPGYRCECNPGYAKSDDDKECLDTRSCSKESKSCTAHAVCLKKAGEYKCHCNAGYLWKGQHCRDMDECERGTHNCDDNAVCINTRGNYKCRCKEGYKELKEGRLCLPKKTGGKASGLSSIIFIVAPVGCFVLAIILTCVFLCLRCRKRRKSRSQSSNLNAAEKALLILERNQAEQQQQMFMMTDTYMDIPMPPPIPTNPSAISYWSDEENDYDAE